MTDNLLLAGFVLIFFQEIRGSGKCDLINVFLHLVSSHSQAIVNELKRLFLRVYQNLNFCLIVCGHFVFAHQIQLFQLGDGVAAVGN